MIHQSENIFRRIVYLNYDPESNIFMIFTLLFREYSSGYNKAPVDVSSV